ARAQRQVWVWGAGHVGRALVAVLAPLPGMAITWVDVAAERFPEVAPEGVTVVPAANPGLLVAHAPKQAEHLVLTYSHALDLDLCHRLLGHGFARCGLIGSATKWARFRSRLAALGHPVASIARIDCPIGDPGLGKHPQAIAIGVAAEFLAGQVVSPMQEGRKA
ncbi:MAG: xanthine dehydrogenase accessory protein XdhC, partial [Pseudomonadota bacterium]